MDELDFEHFEPVPGTWTCNFCHGIVWDRDIHIQFSNQYPDAYHPREKK